MTNNVVLLWNIIALTSLIFGMFVHTDENAKIKKKKEKDIFFV